MKAKRSVLEYLAANSDKSFSIGELARNLSRDRSNVGKAIRELKSENKINYEADIGRKGSKVSHKKPHLPHLPHLTKEKKPHLPHLITRAEEKEKVVEKHITPKITPTRKPRVIKPKEPSITKSKLLDMLDYDIWMDQYKTNEELKNLESAKDLKQKLNVKGNPKFREINNERGKRFVRYVLNITRAMIKKE